MCTKTAADSRLFVESVRMDFFVLRPTVFSAIFSRVSGKRILTDVFWRDCKSCAKNVKSD